MKKIIALLMLFAFSVLGAGLKANPPTEKGISKQNLAVAYDVVDISIMDISLESNVVVINSANSIIVERVVNTLTLYENVWYLSDANFINKEFIIIGNYRYMDKLKLLNSQQVKLNKINSYFLSLDYSQIGYSLKE